MLLISDYCKTAGFLEQIADYNVGTAFALFLGSGALGYIFAQFYWAFVSVTDLNVDLRQAIRGLNRRFVLILTQEATDQGYRELNDGEVDKLSKWEVGSLVSSYWASIPSKSGKTRDDDHPLPMRLVDVMHGLGTTLVGTTFSFLVWFVLHFYVLILRPLDLANTLLPFLIWAMLWCVFGCAFKSTLHKYTVVNCSLVTTAIMKDCDRGYGEPVQLYLYLTDRLLHRRRRH